MYSPTNDDTAPAAAGMPPVPVQTLPVTEGQLRERSRRLALVEAVVSLLARGVSLRSAAALLGEPLANLSRYHSAWLAGGLEGLTPQSVAGRQPKFALTTEEAAALKNLRLKKGSFALAVEWFAREEACRPETRALIQAELDRAARNRREPAWPDSLRRAGHVTEDESALFRGRKHFQGIEFVERRGLEWVDEDGQRLPLLPNTVWESDDMSSNEPFTWTERLAPRQAARPEDRAASTPELAFRIGRQTLCTIDVAACHWLGCSPIGRERDAYRVEDIAEHMLDCVRAHGLPRIWRLERGAWENNFIDGIKVAGREERWGALDPLIRIVRAWKSRQKGTVESSFDLLQSLLAHSSTSIGRVRGEFEEGTKLFLAAGQGDRAAWSRFWGIEECADAFARAMGEFNHRPKKRRAHGRDLVVPADLYRAVSPVRLREEDAWRFSPVKREATVRGGHIECTVDHYPLAFRFRVNGVEDGLYCEHGYKVLIAFHPGHPERGCHLFNAETGSFNRHGFAFGERLLLAPMAEDAPQVNLSALERQDHARKNANAAVRKEFREIKGAGAPAVRTSTVRDGFGDSAMVERQGDKGTRGHGEAAPRRGMRPISREEEAAELARIEALEAEAMARGDLQTF